MFNMDWKITFITSEGKKYNLGLLAECEIISSVDNLTDSAVIILPESNLNDVFNVQGTLKRGTQVIIELGYDGKLKTEFVGYIHMITTNDSSLKIICEDALYLYRNKVKDIELKETNLKKIAELVSMQIDPSYKVISDYNITYEKFVIHQATGFDVLKKLQSETKANIYFNTEKKELHIHPPYIEKGGDVLYSMQHNIEQSSLEYKKAIDKKYEITVESTNTKGKTRKITSGTTGGDQITIKVGAMSEADMKKIANSELLKRSSDGYEGSFDAWLVPFVHPTYSAYIKDKDYPYKDGRYYVVSVTTNFSASGAKRTVQLGIKLS